MTLKKYNFIDDITTKSFNSIFCNSVHKNFKDTWSSPIRIYIQENVNQHMLFIRYGRIQPNLTDLTAIRHIERELEQQ